MADEDRATRAEHELRQAQKMEALGALASGVAHDLNNLLSVILSYSALLAEDPETPVRARADLTEIQRAGERAADLTRQLLAFSRQQVLQPRVIRLSETLGGIERILRRLVREDIEISFATSSQLGKVKVDPGQIVQVVINLAVNARDAMPRGGRLAIEATDVDVLAGDELARGAVAPGAYVMLAVTDTGVGMDAETQARMFEPFYTTKEKGLGTGLGLATVLGIVQQSGGTITAKSEVGRGTRFEILLPRVDETTSPPRATPDARATVGGGETVLLVEDEEHVRVVAETILRRFGYTVLAAANGEEAVRLAEAHPATIHLLVTDVVMPRIGGPDLAATLVEARPSMKVLFMSGYPDKVGAAAAAILQKPLTPDSLARKVREVLDS